MSRRPVSLFFGFGDGQFTIERCPHSCIAHFCQSDSLGNYVEIPLSLDNCEFIIEKLQEIIEKKISAVPIHPLLAKQGRKPQ